MKLSLEERSQLLNYLKLFDRGYQFAPGEPHPEYTIYWQDSDAILDTVLYTDQDAVERLAYLLEQISQANNWLLEMVIKYCRSCQDEEIVEI